MLMGPSILAKSTASVLWIHCVTTCRPYAFAAQSLTTARPHSTITHFSWWLTPPAEPVPRRQHKGLTVPPPVNERLFAAQSLIAVRPHSNIRSQRNTSKKAVGRPRVSRFLKILEETGGNESPISYPNDFFPKVVTLVGYMG